ncbi:hypothetical protein PR048_009037 [Dryococelus australis]|uniref:Uncharacterized protein n=1 Tax=Dryococelus australis TaxID=614101 RepID=A0ABQ9I0M1_9NEOP|nr:hypothetical protein PR048_009037 [Dryococelus australis]
MMSFSESSIRERESNESIAKRGANEMGTCILVFLQEICQTQQHLVFYLNNSAGQNKNNAIASLYLFAVETLNIPRITQKYLVPGDSQNEGDYMHATIGTNKVGKCYIVKELKTEDIKYLKKLAKEIRSNYNVNEDGQKVNWNFLKVIEAREDSPNTLFYKTDYEENDFKTILVYENSPRLPRNKIKDILDLFSSSVIPRIHHPLFNNLQAQENNIEGEKVNEDIDEVVDSILASSIGAAPGYSNPSPGDCWCSYCMHTLPIPYAVLSSLNIEVVRADEVDVTLILSCTGIHGRGGDMPDSREYPLTSGIVLQYSQMRKSSSDPAYNSALSALVGG